MSRCLRALWVPVTIGALTGAYFLWCDHLMHGPHWQLGAGLFSGFGFGALTGGGYVASYCHRKP